ncbi:hypothetical protein K2173_018133 [Erythroxylum novogranatense]|uniref:non-specific serine/threonine protein kinase n=1 Tax=Erythroxylum novogranatense TaxID=1862640 RepID=A0AAV8U9Q5_9ROSI|nr:hypothetical protein K2173_018133 [Erythroxylum novogranatense]
MGRNTKKKKKGGHGGGGRRSKALKDHSCGAGDDGELLEEEITALCAIYQEDCKIVSDSPPQIIIKIRPYLKDKGNEDVDISALLSVRCLPGYPYKRPKLEIVPEEGLTKNDADKLLSLLHDQANSNAQEGRVMIHNLVEAAQEFLSGIKPLAPDPLLLASQDHTISKSTSFVYGFLDLFSGCGVSWQWGIAVDDNMGINSSLMSHPRDGSRVGYGIQEMKLDKITRSFASLDTKQDPWGSAITKLDTLEEESEDNNKLISTTNSQRSLTQDSVGDDVKGEDVSCDQFEVEDDDDDVDFGTEIRDSMSSSFIDHNQTSQDIRKDLLMVHLLRLVCASKGAIADSLPEITNELCSLGIFSEYTRDLASKPSLIFNKTFDSVFYQNMVSSSLSQFWKSTLDLGGSSTSSPSSRYLNDFEELRSIGQGGFGHVVLCKNKLDGRHYAVKKVRLKDKNLPVDDRILREVATLSRLQHQHVVRYYQAWFETGVADSCDDSLWGSGTVVSSSLSHKVVNSADVEKESKLESTYLYIQMEYCPRTLRQVFESYNHFDEELAWHWFRQIVEGLAHIHGQGIIHRDLTPNNIFFDARNDIKIGDFGLAKFLKLEQLDHDSTLPLDSTGFSVDGTGQVGTYLYTAPEIEQGWPKINEKVDMYSLGVVFFELWHPFGTAMERQVILFDLKQKGELPSSWVDQFRDQETLMRKLMSPNPSDRPSAVDLLKSAFPRSMESELLDNILRTMHTSENNSVYDKVVSAIFDEEVLEKSIPYQDMGIFRRGRNDTSAIQYLDSNTKLRDYVVEFTREVFRLHCAKHLEFTSMRLLDDCPNFSRNTIKLLTSGGDLIELCHELRLPFVCWFCKNLLLDREFQSQRESSFKRYDVSHVYRRSVGHSPPNRYAQGDFDIIRGASALTEAEITKVTLDITTHFFHPDECHIHVNHGKLLDAIWSWAGIEPMQRQKVAEVLSMMVPLRPQSSERELKWVEIRRQLLQELNLAEVVVNRLRTVGLRFCGPADQALPRLRGALPVDKYTRKALDELSNLFIYLRVWMIEKHVYIDPLMPPTESYHRDLFFQYVSLERTFGRGLR